MKFCVSSKIIVLLIGFYAVLLIGAGSAKADFTFGTPTNLGPVVNSPADDHPGGMSADGLRLYFSSQRSWGYGWFDIWVATRPTKDDPWEEPVNLGSAINTTRSEFEPDISPDELILVFTRVETDYPNWGIWMSTRPTRYDPWGQRVNLGPTVNSSVGDAGPSMSADGLTLFIDSTRSGGAGGADVWMTTRQTKEGTWAQPVNLGPPVNSSADDGCPDISADGRTLFFNSNRQGGSGDRDLYVTTRQTTNDPWCTPINLGPSINTSAMERRPKISADGRLLLFESNRRGGSGGTDIWQVPIILIVDFNGDGFVDSADMCIMVDHWGENYSLCDIGPTPLGDGIIDVKDLIVLAEHLFEEVPPPGLVAHWKLDETEGFEAQNSVGLQNGFLFGDPIWHPAGGKIDGALELDGIDDYVITVSALNPADGPFSVFAWIKGGAPGQVIISQVDETGTGETWLGIDTLEGYLMTGLAQSPLGRYEPEPLSSESVITDDQWHHIGFVWDGSYRFLYVDGAEVAKDTKALTQALMSSNGGLYIGVGKDLDAASFFSGLIDDISIYNRALSTEEIEKLLD